MDGLHLAVASHDPEFQALHVENPMLLVAGFTGRDPQTVERHLAELAELGIAPPPRMPMVFALPNWLLRLAPTRVQTLGPGTSGEVEPVLIRMPGGRDYVTVGSDHTDRELERCSYGIAKLACPKILAGEVWPFDDVADRWDELRLASFADDQPYQAGALSAIRHPHDVLADVLERCEPADRPIVLFLGTIPLLTGSRGATRFMGRLQDGERSLSLSYHVDEIEPHDTDLSGLSHLAKVPALASGPSADGTRSLGPATSRRS
jgi:Protein of unknown function (DUF2848)